MHLCLNFRVISKRADGIVVLLHLCMVATRVRFSVGPLLKRNLTSFKVMFFFNIASTSNSSRKYKLFG